MRLKVNGQGIIEFSGDLQVVADSQPDDLPHWSQNDPRWRDMVFAGNATFGQAGCYVVSIANLLARIAGYRDVPPLVAARLRAAGCFTSALLTNPERISRVYPDVRFVAMHRWHDRPAPVDVVVDSLASGPVILEVDFRPTTREFNQHFVLGLRYLPEFGDVLILDSWDGQECHLLDRYALVWYAQGRQSDLAHAICGMRVFRRAG